MREKIYWAIFAIIGVPALLGIFKVPYYVYGILRSGQNFSDLLYRMNFSYVLYIAIFFIIFVSVTILALRRAYLTIKKRRGVPASFQGWMVKFSGFGLLLLLIGVATLLLSIAIKTGSGVVAGLIIGPAYLCINIAFISNEVASLLRRE